MVNSKTRVVSLFCMQVFGSIVHRGTRAVDAMGRGSGRARAQHNWTRGGDVVEGVGQGRGGTGSGRAGKTTANTLYDFHLHFFSSSHRR